MTTIREMAQTVRLIDDADFASDRQIGAANSFFSLLEEKWPEDFGSESQFHEFCLKATEDEMVDEALAILGLRADEEVQS